MRIWDVSPGYLDRKRLLGEHRELHGLVNILTLGRKGYAHHPETLRWVGFAPALCLRHALLQAEMRLRGYQHHSPVPDLPEPTPRWPDRWIDPPAAQFGLLRQKMQAENSMRIALPRNSQELWAQHKYSVMAHAPNLYRDIGPQVAGGSFSHDMDALATLLVEALRSRPDSGHMRNALQHMWGYIEWHGELPAADLQEMLRQTQRQAVNQEVNYLLASTALSELAAWLE